MKVMSFRPKLFDTLKNYSRADFLRDLMAGVIVGIVALPLAIAFGIASGVSPEKGIITAVIAGFVVSLLGGSRVQIGGPTGAFIIIVYGIVQQYGEAGLLVATLMGGVLLVAWGFAGWARSSGSFPIRRGGLHSRYRRDDLHDAGRRPPRARLRG